MPDWFWTALLIYLGVGSYVVAFTWGSLVTYEKHLPVREKTLTWRSPFYSAFVLWIFWCLWAIAVCFDPPGSRRGKA